MEGLFYYLFPMNINISTCVWLDNQGQEAAEFYSSLFPGSRIMENSPMMVTMEIAGQTLSFLNGGPLFPLNPAISFFYHCESEFQLDFLWSKLIEGGSALMPLDNYPFAKKYGWLADKFGVNWQLMLPFGDPMQIFVPSLMFTGSNAGKAEEALELYTSLFASSKKGTLSRYPAGPGPDKEGTLNYGEFSLGGQWFTAMDSAHPHGFTFNEGVSLVISCDTQEEVDHFWSTLTQDGEEGQCGWLKDKYGVSWQVIPRVLGELLRDPERASRVTACFMKMKKLVISELLKA